MHGVPVAAVALAWTLGRANVTATIVGPDSIRELADCAVACVTELEPEEADELTRLSWYESEPEFVEW